MNPQRRRVSFDKPEQDELAGLPLEQQVVRILVEHGNPLAPANLRSRLAPNPTAPAFETLIAHMKRKKLVADFPAGRVGLPGWAMNACLSAPSAPANEAVSDEPPPAEAALTTKEIEMPKRATLEESQQQDDAVLKFITAAADPVSRSEISQGLEIEDPKAVGRALKRLQKAKKIHGRGRGPGVKWAVKPAQSTAPARTHGAAPPPRATNGSRFGLFSDGTLSIECEGCRGTLTPAEFQALRAFAERFEGAAQ